MRPGSAEHSVLLVRDMNEESAKTKHARWVLAVRLAEVMRRQETSVLEVFAALCALCAACLGRRPHVVLTWLSSTIVARFLQSVRARPPALLPPLPAGGTLS